LALWSHRLILDHASIGREESSPLSGKRADISVILPYWERGDALVASLAAFAARYSENGPALELVIADDGSPTEPAAEALLNLDGRYPFPIRLVQLPRKDLPKNPSVPINRAVAASSGSALFLSSPECRHDQAVLGEALAAHIAGGWKSIIVCAVHDEVSDRWFSHSLHAPNRYHFANLISRQQFDEVGGFDEDYRDGYCFDDPDFVERLELAEVIWIDPDDQIVRHTVTPSKKSKQMPNKRELWIRNRDLFRAKWGRDPEGTF